MSHETLDLKEPVKYLLFRLGQEHFCVDLSQLSCVSYELSPQFLPLAHEYVMGLISLRGQLAVQIDLCKKYNIKRPATEHTDCILYVDTPSGRMAFPVQEVIGVVTVHETDLLRSYPKPAGVPEEFIKGAIRSEEKIFLALDIVKGLNESDLMAISQTHSNFNSQAG